MSTKKYQFCRLMIIFILSMSISISITLENYYLPLIFMLSAFAALSYCRQQLKSSAVVADERDYKMAGKAARYAIYIYCWLGAIGTFVLMAISNKEGLFYSLSQYLAFSVCFLMLLNACLFKYFIKKKNND